MLEVFHSLSWSMMLFLGVVFSAAITGILTDDLRAFIPKICKYLLVKAALKLPTSIRARYQEEWLSEIDHFDTVTEKLVQTLSLYCFGASNVRAVYDKSYSPPHRLLAERSAFILVAMPIATLVMAPGIAALTFYLRFPLSMTSYTCRNCDTEHKLLVVDFDYLLDRNSKLLHELHCIKGIPKTSLRPRIVLVWRKYLENMRGISQFPERIRETFKANPPLR